MDEGSAPPLELGEEDAVGEARTLHMGERFGWGMPLPGSGNPYPPSHQPPPYYTYPPEGVGGGGLYPNIGFQPGFVNPHLPPYAPPHGVFMECPVCNKGLKVPVYKCRNNHTICNECANSLDYCTKCYASLEGPKIRNFEVERMIGGGYQQGYVSPGGYHVTEVKCPNAMDGCEISITNDKMRSHLEVCEFRSVQFCAKLMGWTHCPQEVNSSTVLDHLRGSHQVKEMFQDKFTLKLTLPTDVIHSQTSQGLMWDPLVITSGLERDSLLRCCVSPQGHLLITCFLLGGTLHEARKYRVKYELNSSAKSARLEWTGGVLSFRHHSHRDSELLPNVNIFCLPLDSLKQFTTPDPDSSLESRLKLRISIWSHTDLTPPYRECFRDLSSGEKFSMEEITLSSSPSPDHSFSETLYIPSQSYISPPHFIDPSSTSTSTCHHCTRPIYSVTYQCLQCPEATYFCKNCVEILQLHTEHLTIRIPSPEQIPLGAVVYECASGEI